MKLPKIRIFDKLSDKQLEVLFMICFTLAVFTFGMLIGSKL